MKKRSLVSAVAMLLVSALVLTSATFAWFASSGAPAQVSSFKTEINNSDGGIVISTDKANWTNSLSSADYLAINSNALPSELTPVSGLPGADSVTFVGGTLTGTSFVGDIAKVRVISEGPLAHDGDYVYYKTYVKAQVPGDLTISTGFTTTSDFTYYAIGVKTSPTAPEVAQVLHAPSALLLAKAAPTDPDKKSYTPITNDNGIATDNDDTDFVIGPDEVAPTVPTATVTLGTPLAATATDEQDLADITMAQDEVIAIEVWMWAEGQDPECRGRVSGLEAVSDLDLSFTAAPVTP